MADLTLTVSAPGAPAAAQAVEEVSKALDKTAASGKDAAAAGKENVTATKETTAASKEAAQAVKEEAEATKQAATVERQATVTTNGAVQAKKQAAAQARAVAAEVKAAAKAEKDAAEEIQKAQSRRAQGLLALGNSTQDFAAAGLRGVLNNIPQLITLFGGTAGLAGGITIAAVGLDLLIDKFDIFGSKASDAADEAKNLSDKLNQNAAAARENALHMDAQQEATRRNEETTYRLTMAFTAEKKAIDESTDSLLRRLKAEQALADARAAYAAADIDLQEANGSINSADAAYQRRDLQRQQDQERFDREQRESRARVAKETEDGNRAAREAQTARRRAMDTAAGGNELLDADERKRLEEEKKNTEDELNTARKKREELMKNYAPNGWYDPNTGRVRNAPTGPGSNAVFGQNPFFNDIDSKAKAREKEIEDRLKRIDERQKADQAAQDRTGIKSAEERDKQEREFRRQAEQKDIEAREAFERARQTKEEAKNRAEIFGLDQSTKDKVTDTRVLEITKREEEKARREKERQERDEARDRARLRKGADGILAADGLLPPKLQKELEQTLEANPMGGPAVVALIDKILAILKQKKLEDTEIARRLAAQEALMEDLRTGR